MSTTLRPFLAEIATDPDKMAAFLTDPDAMARAAGLDDADRAALRSADQGSIHARLERNRPDPTTHAVTGPDAYPGATDPDSGASPDAGTTNPGSRSDADTGSRPDANPGATDPGAADAGP
jgi:hypothetical protein